MQNKLSKLLVISGLVMFTRTVDAMMRDVHQDQRTKTSADVFIQPLDTP